MHMLHYVNAWVLEWVEVWRSSLYESVMFYAHQIPGLLLHACVMLCIMVSTFVCPALWYTVHVLVIVAGSFPEVKGIVVQRFPTEDRKEAPLPAGFEIVSSPVNVYFAHVQ